MREVGSKEEEYYVFVGQRRASVGTGWHAVQAQTEEYSPPCLYKDRPTPTPITQHVPLSGNR